MDDREVGPASRSGATVGDGDSQIFASRPLFWRRMLLTIRRPTPATDLGFLLHKHPNVSTAELPFGKAHVFYPEATDERCTAALLLDVDPVGLVRRGVRRRLGSTSTSTTVRTSRRRS